MHCETKQALGKVLVVQFFRKRQGHIVMYLCALVGYKHVSYNYYCASLQAYKCIMADTFTCMGIMGGNNQPEKLW